MTLLGDGLRVLVALAIGIPVALLIADGWLRLLAFVLVSAIVLALLDRAWPRRDDSTDGASNSDTA